SLESASSEIGPTDPTTIPRSGASRNALNALNERRGHSPSASSDNGIPIPPSLRAHENSPKSGSPATQNSTLVQSKISLSDLNARYEHSKSNSTDSGRGYNFY